MSKTLGWGVVGIGNIVEGTMAPAMVADEQSRIVAGMSRDMPRAEAFKERFGATSAYDDYDAMLADPDVEAVFIATPNALHAEQVIAAAKAGRHVMCDKPMATSVADAVREVEACAAAGVRFGINFHNRHLPWVLQARTLVRDGAIGQVRTVQVEASAGYRPPDSWRNDPDLAGLGTVYGQGVHVLDFVRFILGADPAEVIALFDYDDGRYRVETQAMILMRMTDGTSVYVNTNQTNPHPQNDIAIYGREGRIVGQGLTRSRFPGELHVRTAAGDAVTAHPNPSGEAHAQSLTSFTDAVLADRELAATGLDGLHSMLLVDAIVGSVRDRCLATVDYSPLASFSHLRL